MKHEVEYAFQDLQEALRGNEGASTIVLDTFDLEVVLRWAEKHGLMPDYQEGDRVQITRKGAKNSAAHVPWLKERMVGTVVMVDDNLNHGGSIRVLWDDDPKDDPYPLFVSPREVERVYE